MTEHEDFWKFVNYVENFKQILKDDLVSLESYLHIWNSHNKFVSKGHYNHYKCPMIVNITTTLSYPKFNNKQSLDICQLPFV